MDILESLFPQHDPAFLRQWLDNSKGEVPTAIESILSLPPPPEASSTSSHKHIKHDTKHSKYDTFDLANGVTQTYQFGFGDTVGNGVKGKHKHPEYDTIDLTNGFDFQFDGTLRSDDKGKHHKGKNVEVPWNGDKSKHKGKIAENVTKNGGKGKPLTSSSSQVCDLTLDSSDDDLADLVLSVEREDLRSSSSFSSSRPPKNHQQNDLDDLSDEETPEFTPFDAFHLEQKRLQREKEEREAALERERLEMVANFVTSAQELFQNISVAYLEKLMEEMRPQAKDDTELVEICVEKIFALNGAYPKAKRKRSDSMDGDERATSSRRFDDGVEEDEESDEGAYEDGPLHNKDAVEKLPPRDFMDCKVRMSGSYDTDSAMQLYQDFPRISTTSIRACLKLNEYHYAPTFYFLTDAWNKLQLEDNKGKLVIKTVKISETKSTRKAKPPRNPRSLDPDFRRELESVKTKLAKEIADLEEAEEEERNLKFYTDLGALIECGCCYDDVPPNRTASCEEGHMFCWSCCRRGAESELGYRRTVLKCMAGDCKSSFPDSEAKKFLVPAVFNGLQLARQQQEIKMAGLDSLVECPFCLYAAVVENDDDKEFRCMGRKCRKVSCRLCKAPTHIPLSCDEYQKEQEKNSVLSVQHKLEEHMSEALIRECPKCKSRFFKTEGCNKMTCPQCNTKMCYICKIQIRDYSHFDQTPAGQPQVKKNLCRLWDDTVQRNANDVKAAAQQMIQELRKDKADLVSKMVVDIPK
ncbi:hypothetical protein BG003_008055 [Podila horticola]|nr:hypothetical protein BG003_008055 [Podila horticola]